MAFIIVLAQHSLTKDERKNKKKEGKKNSIVVHCGRPGKKRGASESPRLSHDLHCSLK